MGQLQRRFQLAHRHALVHAGHHAPRYGTAQRGFQANSRVISTSDEMLQDLVNLKR